ncbi:ABC transporter ATP-binding protein [Candidatus Neptunochlamydia vexilliferae]|uniref:Dipeptide transport ATP-binding protein DppD n=1 Tax=Candidatus Neptunichlamydia vexilliferae TaxID=1651774 RepID=A0ABS0AYA1_9BACT|nr:ABC transporter ATP-binding protein [Candidatus Neptunochlamydia vexilliferae]MBF5059108.1 Dipeptide transport ATP-binding protein DppD [Candidatus Neptunochlamydia vexilliferae]
MKELLEVENLHTSFSSLSKKIAAVRGVSFKLKEGETVGIVGESGCGKSVMARSLTRLLPSVSAKVEKGSVFYHGENLLLKSERELRKVRGKEIGMIFQDPMTSLNPTMRIIDQITEGYALHHPEKSKEEVAARALALLEKVGISDARTRLRQYPHELSGGMRQRVMIAIAMISSPNILIADEPTTALDVTIQAQILDLLKEIQQKEKMSILLITHDFSIIAGFCDRVVVMYAGEVVESAPVDELFSAPKHPYTRRLLNSIPRLDLPSKKQLYSIHGSPPDLSHKIKGCSFAKRCPHAMHICNDGKPKAVQVGEEHTTSCWLFDPRIERKRRLT